MVVFARAPRLGQVKTRLAAGVGDELALAIYRRLGECAIGAAGAVAGCHVEVRFTPQDGREDVASWLGRELLLRPQADGDLGVRMHAAIEEAVAEGAEAVVIIGTDCPALTATTIARAFEELAHVDVVLGPALDGGYYLIAMRQAHAAVFLDIPWSTPETLARTVAAANTAGLRVGLLGAHPDIDTAEDWRQWLASGP